MAKLTKTPARKPKRQDGPTAADLAEYLKRNGIWSTPTGDMKLPVVVIDARYIFGRIELKVSPIGGSGSTWVTAGSVELAKEAK
jgi:hypothetical protein